MYRLAIWAGSICWCSDTSNQLSELVGLAWFQVRRHSPTPRWFSSSSRLAQACSLGGCEEFLQRAEVSGPPEALACHCHFLCVLLVRASHKVSQVQREGNWVHLLVQVAAKPHYKGAWKNEKRKIITAIFFWHSSIYCLYCYFYQHWTCFWSRISLTCSFGDFFFFSLPHSIDWSVFKDLGESRGTCLIHFNALENQNKT